MKTKMRINFLLCGLFCIIASVNYGQIKITFDVPDNYTWKCPQGIDSISLECWGGGGGGGGAYSPSNLGGQRRGGGGGGGGTYTKSFLSVTPNISYSIVVGNGGVGGNFYNGSDGSHSSFGNNIVKAVGGNGGIRGYDNYPNGAGGTGGNAALSVGQFGFYGADGISGNPFLGGGGGSSAGFSQNGVTGSSDAGGVAPLGGGNGGNGGIGACSSQPYNGSNGNQPGGGGGGGFFCNIVNYALTANGGNGGNGKVVITYLNKRIGGYIYNDFNHNCIKDTLESPLPNTKCTISPGNFICISDINGMWYLDSLPAGNYTLTIDVPKNWATSCSVNNNFNVPNSDSTVILNDIGLYYTILCPSPKISIFAPNLTRCFSEKIYVSASNQIFATSPLLNSYAEIQLDSLLIFNNASIPYINLGGNKYRFQLDTLNPGQCKSFNISAHISCSSFNGQTLCAKAELFPVEPCVFDTMPTPSNPDNPIGWIHACNLPYDNSNLVVEGWCQNDTVYFTIVNTGLIGIGNMQCYSPIRIYIDDVLTYLDSIQLVGGASKTYAKPGNGKTWILQVDQHPLHPGNSHPTAHVEACGNPANWTPGLVNDLPLDNSDPISNTYCGIVTGSHDPNDKKGYPTGISTSHYIHPNQSLEYVIRFQNTGTDTAFTVVIRDTLDTDLSIFSVIQGVSSHNNEFRMYGSRVLEWKFENILLPDSSTNEPASHGFVTFMVDQVSDLPNGTIINNKADIYFDFNAPVITNQTFHIVNDSIQSNPLITKANNQLNYLNEILIYPNPALNSITIESPSIINNKTISIYNIQGQLLLKQSSTQAKTEIDIRFLAKGIYIVKVESTDNVIVKKFVKN